MTGRIIQGKFEVLREIGHGGMGVVYRARQISLDRIVALKVLSSSLTEDEEFHDRFRQEAKIVARLNHPHIVQVYDIYDVETNGGVVCIVMEYVDGRPLREISHEAGRMPVKQAVNLAMQIASGLAYAHKQGIVHRDIKPDNIMVLGDEHVKIMDFGIARLRDSSVHTQPGMTMGTPQFMSPEQAAGKTVDARSDIYSLGIVLYRMVTGKLPFTGDSPISIALKHVQEPPPPPSELNPAVPPVLESIILKAIAKRPDDRFQTGAELREALEEFRDTGKAAAVAATADGEPGEETFVSTPAIAPAVIGEDEGSAAPVPTPPTATPFWGPAERPPGALPAVAVSPTPSSGQTPVVYATPVPQHRFNWPWVAAAIPGILALVMVLSYAFGLIDTYRVTVSELREAPIEELIRKLDQWETVSPNQARRFIKRNERDLYNRFSRLLSREGPMPAGRGAIYRLRGLPSSVIGRNLTPEARRRWDSIFEQLRLRNSRPPGRRDGGIPRSVAERLEVEESLRRLHKDVEQDPLLAQQSFEEADAIFEKLETAQETDQRARLFHEGFNKLIDSVRYDRNNARYGLELEKRMTAHGREFLGMLPADRVEQESRRLLAQAATHAENPDELRAIEARLSMYVRRDQLDAQRSRIVGLLENGVDEIADLGTTEPLLTRHRPLVGHERRPGLRARELERPGFGRGPFRGGERPFPGEGPRTRFGPNDILHLTPDRAIRRAPEPTPTPPSKI